MRQLIQVPAEGIKVGDVILDLHTRKYEYVQQTDPDNHTISVGSGDYMSITVYHYLGGDMLYIVHEFDNDAFEKVVADGINA